MEEHSLPDRKLLLPSHTEKGHKKGETRPFRAFDGFLELRLNLLE
jgi:hypothetical protein